MPDLEKRVRSLTRTPAPDLWDEIRSREPAELGRQSRANRTLIVVVAFAVAATGFSAAVLALGHGGAPSATSTAVPATGSSGAGTESPPAPTASPSTVSVRVTEMKGIAEFPSTVVAGDGGAWVSAPLNDGTNAGAIVHIDGRNGAILGRVSLPYVPTWEFGGGGMMVANGRVWVAGSGRDGASCCRAFVSVIDENTDRLVGTIPVRGDVRFAADVWVNGSSAYLLSFAKGDNGMVLARVDLISRRTVWVSSLPTHWADNVFVAGGSVWVPGPAPRADLANPEVLYRIRPETGEVIGQFGVPGSVYAPVIENDVVWWIGDRGRIERWDAATEEMLPSLPQPAAGCCGVRVAETLTGDGGDGVWATSSSGDGHHILHLDASGNVLASGSIDHTTYAALRDNAESWSFDPVTNTIWVQHYKGPISRIELTTRP